MFNLNRLMLPFGIVLSCLVLSIAALTERPVAGQSLQWQLAEGDSADVIVSLVEPPMRQFEERELAIAAMQAHVLHGLDSAEITHQYETLPMLALTVNANTLAQLQQDPRVVAIEPDLTLNNHLEDAVANTGAAYIHDTFRIKGTDVAIAVFDTGMQGDHPDFSVSRTIGQQCFTDGDCLTDGGDFTASVGELAEDNNGHGTHVTGIIASNGTKTIPGFAPEAKIVSVRVLDRNGNGRLSDLLAGLDWIEPSVTGFNLRLINLSLGVNPRHIISGTGGTVGLHSDSCAGASAAMDTAIAALRSRGVIFFASAGNEGSSTKIAFPACHPDVIAVGATHNTNTVDSPTPNDCDVPAQTTITCFSNSNAQVQLVAPGAPITASARLSTSQMIAGTSQSSAVATGVAALLLQADPTLTQAQLLNIMTRTATTVTDSKNGMTFPLLNARKAVEFVLPTVYIPIAIKP